MDRDRPPLGGRGAAALADDLLGEAHDGDGGSVNQMLCNDSKSPNRKILTGSGTERHREKDIGVRMWMGDVEAEFRA